MSGSRLLYSQAWLQAPRFSSTLIPLKPKSIAQDPEPQASSPKEQLHQRFGRAPRKPPTQARDTALRLSILSWKAPKASWKWGETCLSGSGHILKT